MKTLNQYISEAFRINKDTKIQKYNYHPKTRKELKKLIEKLLDERGKDADLNDIDVSKVTDMTHLFVEMDIRNIDISDWDVSNVTLMTSMFYNCTDFNCDLSNWDVSNVTDMINMFCKCHSFNCDLSKWDVSNVKYMGGMFYNCNSLENKPNWFKR